MTVQPAGQDTGSYEVIHLGGQAAVVVPLSDFIRLQALDRLASAAERDEAEDAAARLAWQARKAAGQASCEPAEEVKQRLGLA